MITWIKKLTADTNPLRLAYHWLRSWMEALRAGLPARTLTVIAVTGTDGKTTTVAMIAHILERAGIRAGAVSTAFFEVEGERTPNPTQKTSVSAATLQAFLGRLVSANITHAIIEVSSHGLMQSRMAGICPSVAVITNMAMEHLDYHGTMDEYVRAKSLLFKAMRGHGTKILNADDVSFPLFKKIPSDRTITYSPSTQIEDAQSSVFGTRGALAIDGQLFGIQLPIPGLFNLCNALAAVCTAQALGIAPDKAIAALADFRGAGGRMEAIDAGQTFKVFVDFTVTPQAYQQTLASARAIAEGKRLLVLTGSCGDRMPEKRPIVGKLCAELADITVVTNEDPYTEDPEKIIDEVLSGIPKDIPVFKNLAAVHAEQSLPNKFCIRVSDRLEAIRYLLSIAKPGDVVLLCGKGADVTMMTKNGQIPWDEREIVRGELTKRKN